MLQLLGLFPAYLYQAQNQMNHLLLQVPLYLVNSNNVSKYSQNGPSEAILGEVPVLRDIGLPVLDKNHRIRKFIVNKAENDWKMLKKIGKIN